MTHEYTQRLKKKIRSWGAALVGVADTEPLRTMRLHPSDLLNPFIRAISIAVPLPSSVFEQIIDRPTPIYASVYQTANRILDEIALKSCINLQDGGYHGLPVPASQVLDRTDWYGAISHKAVARMAGLGWQGKSLLLITPRYGPRVRLATILTDAPLEMDSPVKNRCGVCTQCRDACPAGAIKGMPTVDHYRERKEAWDLSRCVNKIVGEFDKDPLVGYSICGICIKACPFGSKLKHERKAYRKNRR